MFLKLFASNIKMIFRNGQSLFWAMAFPLIFTVIFGLFFGQENNVAGTIALVNKSQSPVAVGLEKTINDTGLFTVSDEKDLAKARDLVEKSKISAVIYVPEKFAIQAPDSVSSVDVYYDPASAQTSQVISNFLNSYLTQASFQVQNSKSLFSINMEKTGSDRSFTYFDFVLSGILGLAIMNSSIIGIAVAISTYREEKILKRITSTPLPSWMFIFAEVLARLMLNVIQISLILAVGVYAFHGHIYGNIFIVYLLALVGGILFQLLGFVAASFAKSVDASQSIVQAFTVPMMFLGGIFFPIDALPSWLSGVVQFLPLAPLLRMIRGVVLDDVSPLSNPMGMITVGGWILLALIVTIWRFRLTED